MKDKNVKTQKQITEQNILTTFSQTKKNKEAEKEADVDDKDEGSHHLNQIDSLKEEMLSLKNEIQKKTQIITDKEELINDLMRLNIDLQEKVINLHEDLSKILKSTQNRGEENRNHQESIDQQENIGVGHFEGDKVHLGNNVYLEKTSFDYCFATSKTNSQFVKNLALFVYGHDTLRNSTVTGRPSNRKKEKQGKPRLNPSKLQAIYETFKYFLNKKGTTEVEMAIELSKIGNYISAKIADLNRGNNKGKKPLKAMKQKESETEDDEQDEDGEDDELEEDGSNVEDSDRETEENLNLINE